MVDIRLTKLGGGPVTPSRHRFKVGVRFAVGCRGVVQLPVPLTAAKAGFASDSPPQVQLIVVDGLQYAALAKWVNGVNPLIVAVLSAVIAASRLIGKA